jgi:hypothetical protein
MTTEGERLTDRVFSKRTAFCLPDCPIAGLPISLLRQEDAEPATETAEDAVEGAGTGASDR